MKKTNKVRIKDVAEYAGVSPSTVSNFLNGRYKKMSAQTQKKISEAVSATGYIVDPIAKGLSTGRKNTIGLVWSGSLSLAFEDLYLMAFAKAVRDTLRSYDQQLILIEEDNLLSGARNVDGIILKATRHTEKLIPKIEGMGIPVVTLGRTLHTFHNQVVTVNDKKSGATGVEYLAFLGYQDILVLKTPATMIPGFDDRWQGVKEVIDTKKEVKLKTIECELTRDMGRQILSEIAEKDNLPQAIFSLNDETAVGVIEACKDYNINIPGDLAVIGIDDMPTIAKFVGLTTIHHPIYDLGRTAAQELVKIIESDKEINTVDRVLPTHLIIRDTCGGRDVFSKVEREFNNVVLE